GDYLVIYRANRNFMGFNYLMEGDMKIMMESSTEGNMQSDFWSGQQDWKIITWRLYESCGVCMMMYSPTSGHEPDLRIVLIPRPMRNGP
ncbi:hypothetical protein Tco_0427196, partial [Tanacetum coccineum]